MGQTLTNAQEKLDIANASPQASPVVLRDPAGKLIAALRVERIELEGAVLRISGWHVGAGRIGFMQDEAPVPADLERASRTDVAATFMVPEIERGHGFEAYLEYQPARHFITWKLESGGPGLEYKFALDLGKLEAEVQPRQRVALGWLEVAGASPLTGDALVAGWALQTGQVEMWVQTADGRRFPLTDGYRYFRQDVLDVHGHTAGTPGAEAGFLLRVSGVEPGASLELMADASGESKSLHSIECSPLPVNPAAAARWMFGVSTPYGKLYERFRKVDVPIISGLISHQQRAWRELPLTERTLGKPATDPNASIIVPLYGRTDFVEHQLMEFSNDEWFRENAELIYVIDDPNLVEPFAAEAEKLHRLYRLPFKWVWGAVNRGFSGANNLGASVARGDYFIFLNSDAFPQEPGWIEALLSVLASRPDLGAVGPRLVYGDGSIQHAGMQFLRREELGIWINHHPYMGIDAELDPHAGGVAIVPAVTGACLAVRRHDFRRICGWDTGYLIGDFEDSDFCLKLRASGFRIGYVPTTQLTHLERQSFKLLGDHDFRNRVVIYNAVRHQSRWGALLEQDHAS